MKDDSMQSLQNKGSSASQVTAAKVTDTKTNWQGAQDGQLMLCLIVPGS